MTWIISLVLAGMLFTSSENNLPTHTNSNYNESNKTQLVRLDETDRFEQTYPLSANGKVSVSNVNGLISVEGWDKNEVKLVAVKIADTRERLADVDIKINNTADSLRVEADYSEWKNRSGSWKNSGKLDVEFHLMVPQTAVLDGIEAVNGPITISNMANVTKASAVNGNVTGSNLRGTVVFSTVNGTAEVDLGALQSESRISLSTVNGRANLVMPSDANATIRADSQNGNIVNDFGLTVNKGQYIGRNLSGTIGNGAAKVTLESVNGNLAIRRK